ncbi:MAG TPA: carboxy terminal-processing peptidase [Saprospiraceae bacterium]|nr:carboxy terminal-processing peptidase [Saprospiraceae bacterium]HMP24243.1 carboxy terminal-processing peptidase [Saprospiraceae bacterium]
MKLRGPIFFSVVLITLLVAAFYPRIDTEQKDALLMLSVLKVMGQLHYEPQPLDDAFSEKVYNLYLDRIDAGRRFLTQQDLKKLDKYRTRLDDEALAGNFDFFDLSLELLNAGIEKSQRYCKQILAEPFDLYREEYVELDSKKRPFPKNDEEMQDFWRRYLKHEVITRVADNLQAQNSEEAEDEPKSLEVLEKEARQSVQETYNSWFERLRKIKRSTRLSYYLSSVTNIFDPHSDYLEPYDKQNFNLRMSGRLEGIGARLQQTGDFTKIASIVVGGPAWKTKELNDNDVILKVAQGDEEAKDIAGMPLDEVVQLIRGEKGTKVRLTVKGNDGATKEVTVTRDVVVFEETFAKSLILEGDTPEEKIGYIYLPSFYGDYENEDGRNCSKDIAIELEKLKAEKVSGIILDLRNNGGGYLNEVVNMSGLFIEKGPIVQVKSRGRKPEVWEDVDPRVQYQGPLAIMVNNFSASASEILAAALQDYGRAVIVGSKSTYGKGTVQRFADLDRVVTGYDDIKPLGEVKLTIQKYYRVNGGSVQLRGVVPDIILPDNYQFIEIGEKDYEYPMAWTEISPLKYNQKVYKVNNLDKIKTNSKKRVQESPIFQEITSYARVIEKQRNETEFPLHVDKYVALSKAREDRAKSFSELFEEVFNPKVANLPTDLERLRKEEDESSKARNEEFVIGVSKDPHVKETVHILRDLIQLNN